MTCGLQLPPRSPQVIKESSFPTPGLEQGGFVLVSQNGPGISITLQVLRPTSLLPIKMERSTSACTQKFLILFLLPQPSTRKKKGAPEAFKAGLGGTSTSRIHDVHLGRGGCSIHINTKSAHCWMD